MTRLLTRVVAVRGAVPADHRLQLPLLHVAAQRALLPPRRGRRCVGGARGRGGQAGGRSLPAGAVPAA